MRTVAPSIPKEPPLSKLAIAAVAAAALALTMGGLASAQSSLRQTDNTQFTTKRPHASTGVVVAIDYFNPQDRAAKPPAVRRIVTRLQAGTTIDPSVVAQCDEPRALAGACPPDSRVGSGTITVATGFPGPLAILTEDTTLFAANHGLIFLTQDRATHLRMANTATVQGNTMTSTLTTPLPGTLPDGGALREIRLNINAISKGSGASRRNLVTTPATCPRSRRWTNLGTFTYADGVTQTVGSSSPCTRPAQARPRHRPAPRATPRPRFTG